MNTLYKVSLICTLLLSWVFTAYQAQSEYGILTEYPEEQAEIMQTLDEIIESVKVGDVDKLISFHAYSPKFTE